MKILVAIGGNALTGENQQYAAQIDQAKVESVAKTLVQLEKDHELVVTHGNGPQVGWLAMQEIDANLPFDMLDAESEGMLGYRLAQAMDNQHKSIRTVSVLTRVEVDPEDPSFVKPTKPVGPVIDREQAEYLASQNGWQFIDVMHGKRRVVPSPRPVRILESKAIGELSRYGYTVICAGGGGIPVADRGDGSLRGIDGVIDKDYTSALLARELNLDAMLLLTNVGAVYSDYGKPSSRAIRRASCSELDGSELMEGSMGPKVEAACDFVKTAGGFACIGKITEARELLDGDKGTRIVATGNTIEWW